VIIPVINIYGYSPRPACAKGMNTEINSHL
jgi:hypothetical protein